MNSLTSTQDSERVMMEAYRGALLRVRENDVYGPYSVVIKSGTKADQLMSYQTPEAALAGAKEFVDTSIAQGWILAPREEQGDASTNE